MYITSLIIIIISISMFCLFPLNHFIKLNGTKFSLLLLAGVGLIVVSLFLGTDWELQRTCMIVTQNVSYTLAEQQNLCYIPSSYYK